MRYLFSFASLLILAFVFSSTAFAQETGENVVDEVVAQVNEGVITLSRVNREAKAIVETDVQQGKDRAESQKMVDERKGELIANLINEELMLQKAKEIGIESDIEASLNQRFLQIMKQYNLKTLDALYQEMEKQGVRPEEMREMWRKQATRDAVIQREVSSKEYWRPNSKELKDYYEKHKSKFTKPETVSLSEIFLGFAGRDENAVREKAKHLVEQLRNGGDWNKIVVENSDRPDAAQSKGKVDPINVKELDPRFAEAIKNVKTGGISDPVEGDDTGINIIRIDERSAASNESVFDENAVRLAILQEKFAEAQKKFMASLRQDSYIKISDTYRPIVSPILFADDRKEKAAADDNK